MDVLLKATTAYRLLAQEAQSNRLANTYLLLFPDADNLRFALNRFARLFFAEKDAERVGREKHPDCLFYPAVGKGWDKDVVTALLEESSLSPVEGERKLFVLDAFHKASAVVQNKLLKVLEEPPAGVHFLIGASNEFPLLATVKSRAKKLEVPPFSEEEVAACLCRRYTDCTMPEVYASVSDGLVGRAENFMLGGTYSKIQPLVMQCVQASAQEIPAVSKKLTKITDKWEFISLLKRAYRDMLFYRTNQPFVTGMGEGLKQAAGAFTPASLLYALEIFSEAEKQLTFNANLAQCVEIALFKIDKEKSRCKKS